MKLKGRNDGALYVDKILKIMFCLISIHDAYGVQ